MSKSLLDILEKRVLPKKQEAVTIFFGDDKREPKKVKGEKEEGSGFKKVVSTSLVDKLGEEDDDEDEGSGHLVDKLREEEDDEDEVSGSKKVVSDPVVNKLGEYDEGERDLKAPAVFDMRKSSNIDRAAIFKKLQDRDVFVTKRIKPAPAGSSLTEPNTTTIKKVTRKVLKLQPAPTGKGEEEDEEQQKKVGEDEEDEESANKGEEEQQKKVEEDEEETPVIIKPARSSRKKSLKIAEPLPYIDLTTVTIKHDTVADRLPAPREKYIMRTPTYYMNNRKLSIQKLTELFAPYKQEIESQTEVTCESRSQVIDFDLLTHQKVVRDYLNLFTPYRGLLLYHNLGTGKTCSSIAMAEGMKSDKRIFVLTPASLKMNFFSELKSCGDEMYKKKQFWEFISIEGKPDYLPMLATALSLPSEFIRRQGGAWLMNIKKRSNFTTLTSAQQDQLDDQLNHMIRTKYVDINYNGMNRTRLNALTADGSKNPFDNSVIIIDEGHNFVSRIVNKIKKPDSISYQLYHYIRQATNARVIILSGTPIINYPNEIGILFNLLRGDINTWTLTLTPTTSEKMTTETILQIFNAEKFKTYDHVEYSGNKLTITRNPFGFINVNKGEAAGSRASGPGPSTKKKGGSSRNSKTKKQSNMIGGASTVNPRYDGVKLDETGNISDDQFLSKVISILRKRGIEVNDANIELRRHKALPDEADAFISSFIELDTGVVKNMNLFQRRILGLTSYYRSAQEKLFPSFVTTDGGDDYHIEKVPMSDHQFDIYQRIRHVEATKEKNAKKRKKLGNDDLFTISSTYRIFSRAACNFTFPSDIERPMPIQREGEEVDESDMDAVPKKNRQESDSFVDLEDVEADPEVDASYSGRIARALDAIAEPSAHYLLPASLESLSPKFAKVLENLQNEENIGLHLIYSHFRTIEGIGILRLILLNNGFAEFKLRKVGNDWQLAESSAEDIAKPHFVLYTGTEEDEEKEIIRNVYNGAWDLIPVEIAAQLRERAENNHLGNIIKIFMITSSGAEGINLKNTRFVHVIEPYWHMVRVEQVIGRARRICSHQDLAEELRNVKVFLYVTTFTEEQKTSEKNRELRLRDVSKEDKVSPVTTDETLYEIATIKQRINGQILKAVKESAMDCTLYSSTNKENLVCFGFGQTSSNNFGSFPSFDKDRDTQSELEVKTVTWRARNITVGKGKDAVEYALNEDTMDLYDLASYKLAEQGQGEPTLIGRLQPQGKGYRIIKF